MNLICRLIGHKWKTYHRLGKRQIVEGIGQPPTEARIFNEFKKCKRCGKKLLP